MRIKSECGQYQAERSDGDSWYKLYDKDGTFLGQCTYWSNKSTNSRIAFETGFGPHRPTFSHPRFPKWFKRLWVNCFDMWIDDLARMVIGHGCEVYVAYKPDMCCWSHIGFRATPKQYKAIKDELTSRGVEWHGPPRKGGGWEIDCPHDPKPIQLSEAGKQ